MNEAVRMLRELRGKKAAAEEEVRNFIKQCEQLNVPKVTIYIHNGGLCLPFTVAFDAFVFTSRQDAREFVWVVSSRGGLRVYAADLKKSMPFEQWDPEGDLFTDPYFLGRGDYHVAHPVPGAIGNFGEKA